MLEYSDRKIFSNSISLIFVAFVTKGTKLLSLLIIVRYFDKEIFGQYALILATSELFRSIADFGIDTTAVKWFASQSKDPKSILLNATVLRFITASAGSFLVILTSLSLGYGELVLWGIAISSLSYFLGLWGNLFRTHFQAALSMDRLVLPSLISSVFYLILVTIGSVMGINILLLISLGVISDGAFLLYLVDAARRRGLIKLERPSSEQLLRLFKASIPFGFLGIVVVSYARISSLIVAQVGGELSIAYYSSAARITEALMIASGAFAASTLPLLTAELSRGDMSGQIRERILYFLRRMGTITTLVSTGVMIFSDKIIGLVFTAEYTQASSTLAILSVSFVFASYNMLFTNILFAADKQRLVLLAAVVVLAINLAVSVFLIPRVGYVGAAIAASISEVINTIIQMGLITKVCRLVVLNRAVTFFLLRTTAWVIACLSLALTNPGGVSVMISLSIMGLYILQMYFFDNLSMSKVLRAIEPNLKRRRR